MSFSKMTHNITTFSKMTLSIMIHTIMTLIVTILYGTLSIMTLQTDLLYEECRYLVH